GEEVPDELHSLRLDGEIALDADLVEGELPVMVEILRGGEPASRLVIVDLPEPIARDGEPIYEALEPDAPLFREGEHDQALDGDGAVAVEGSVAAVVGGEELLALATIVVGRGLSAPDLDVVRPRTTPALVVALEQPLELGNRPLPHRGVELFQPSVDVAAQ